MACANVYRILRKSRFRIALTSTTPQSQWRTGSAPFDVSDRDVHSANTAHEKNKRAFFGYFLCTGKESDSLAERVKAFRKCWKSARRGYVAEDCRVLLSPQPSPPLAGERGKSAELDSSVRWNDKTMASSAPSKYPESPAAAKHPPPAPAAHPPSCESTCSSTSRQEISQSPR
jgi:hypothetical protein